MESTTFTAHGRPIPIDVVSPRPDWGEIGVSSCPGKQPRDGVGRHAHNDLELDLMCIRDWNAKLVLTVLDPAELEELGVIALPAQAQRLGMHWRHLSIRRRYPPGPAFERVWPGVCTEIMELLKAGGRILIHCNEGLARAWTVAACVLVESGMAPEEAIAQVRAVQARAIPSVLQEWYVINYRPHWG